MAEQLTVEDEVLDYTLQKRKELVDSLRIENGTKPPDDPKHVSAYLQALDGIDRQALTKLRIKADKDIGDQQAQSAALIADMLRDPRAGKMGLGQRDEAPVLGADIAPTRILEGELVTGTQADNYDAFMSRQNGPGLPDQDGDQ